MPPMVRFLLEDLSVRDTMDQLSQMQHLPMPPLSRRSSSRSTLAPLTPLNLTMHYNDPSAYASNTFPPPSFEGYHGDPRVRTYGQSWKDPQTLSQLGGQYGDPVGRDHPFTSFSDQNQRQSRPSQPRVTPSTRPLSISQNNPTLFLREDEYAESSSSSPQYLEMMPSSSRRSRTGQNQPQRNHTRTSSNNLVSFPPIPISPTSPLLGPLPSFRGTARSREAACNFQTCTESRLNWSPYCYKHQCRAFQCYEHVCRSNSAYCAKHHQDSNPAMEMA